MTARHGLCGFVLAALLLQAAGAATRPPGIIPVANRQASAFQLADVDGAAYVFTPASDRWRFVHFWASWCGPCRREMPAIERMITRLDDARLEVVLINTAESEDTVFTFLAGIAPDLNSLLDRDGEVTEQWQPRGLPSTYLVDPAGRIRFLALGGRAWDTGEYLDFLKALGADD